MTTKTEIENMTPDQCWDAFVGQQTTTEFVRYCDLSKQDIEGHVCDYVEDLPEMMAVEFAAGAIEALVDNLLAHIEDGD